MRENTANSLEKDFCSLEGMLDVLPVKISLCAATASRLLACLGSKKACNFFPAHPDIQFRRSLAPAYKVWVPVREEISSKHHTNYKHDTLISFQTSMEEM